MNKKILKFIKNFIILLSIKKNETKKTVVTSFIFTNILIYL